MKKQNDRPAYRQATKKVWLVSAAYTGIFQLAAMVAVIAAVIHDHQLLRGDRLEQLGSPYFFAVAVGLCVIFVASTPRLRRTFLQPGNTAMTWRTFGGLVAVTLLVQLIFTGYSNGLESLLNSIHLTANAEVDAATASSETWSMVIYAGLLAPITEELVFRGFILRTMQPFGPVPAVVLSAYLFGLYHLNIMQSPFAMLLGVVLGYVALKYGIKWSIALHAFNNLVLGDVLGRLLEILPQTASSLVNLVIFVGGAGIGLSILWRQLPIFKNWYRTHHPKKGELRQIFLNWSGIVLTLVALVIMVSQIEAK